MFFKISITYYMSGDQGNSVFFFFFLIKQHFYFGEGHDIGYL